MEQFAQRLRDLMNRESLTQKDLSSRARVTESAMSHYLKGDRTPRGEILSRIASALKTTTDYLLNGERGYDDTNGKLVYLQRNLSRLNEQQLKKAEDILRTVFDDIFSDDN